LYKYLGSNLTNVNIEIKNFHLYEKKGKYYIIHHIQSDTQPDSSLTTKLGKYGLKDENKITPENFNKHIENLVRNFDQITWGDLPKIHAIRTVEKTEVKNSKKEVLYSVPKPEVLITDHEGNIEAKMTGRENNGNNKKWKSALPWAQTGIEWASDKSDNDIERQKEINEKYRSFRSKKWKDIADFTERQMVNKLRLCQNIFDKLYWHSTSEERHKLGVDYKKSQNDIKSELKKYMDGPKDFGLLYKVVEYKRDLTEKIKQKGDEFKKLVDKDFADYHLSNFSEKLKGELIKSNELQGYTIEIKMESPKDMPLQIFQKDKNSPIYISYNKENQHNPSEKKHFVDDGYQDDVLVSDNAQWEFPEIYVMHKEQEGKRQLFLTNSTGECNKKTESGWIDKQILQDFCDNQKGLVEKVKKMLPPAITNKNIDNSVQMTAKLAGEKIGNNWEEVLFSDATERVPPLDLLTGEPYPTNHDVAPPPIYGTENWVRFDAPTDQSAEVSLESLESRKMPFQCNDANGAFSTMLAFFELPDTQDSVNKLITDGLVYETVNGVAKLHDENGQPTQLAEDLQNLILSKKHNPFDHFDSLIVYEKDINPFNPKPVKHVLFGNGNENSLSVYFDGELYYRLLDNNAIKDPAVRSAKGNNPLPSQEIPKIISKEDIAVTHVYDASEERITDKELLDKRLSHIERITGKKSLSGLSFGENNCLPSAILTAQDYKIDSSIPMQLDPSRDGISGEVQRTFRQVVDDAREYLCTLAQEIDENGEYKRKDPGWNELRANDNGMLEACHIPQLIDYWINTRKVIKSNSMRVYFHHSGGLSYEDVIHTEEGTYHLQGDCDQNHAPSPQIAVYLDRSGKHYYTLVDS
jgi:hypothetical protein